MATIFTHAILVSGFYYLFKIKRKEILFWTIVSSLVPDMDVLAFNFGIPYEHVLGHRGLTHSLFFALIWSAVVAFLRFKSFSSQEKKVLFILFFIATISHGVLDALTNGGLGVGFFIPFENSRYFFPWTPIEVSPIGRHFFSARGLVTILSEAKFVIIPMIILMIIYISFKKLAFKINK